jgi:hypothetical protein
MIPVVAIGWAAEALRLWRRPPRTSAETDRRLTCALAQAAGTLAVPVAADGGFAIALTVAAQARNSTSGDRLST